MKRVLFSLLSLLFVLSMAVSPQNAQVAKAQGRTITLNSFSGSPELVDSENTHSTSVYLSNKGNFSYLVTQGTTQWEFGDGSTLFLDFLLYTLPIATPQENPNQIDITSNASFTLVSNLSGWTADNTNHRFTHWGTPCGTTGGNVTHTTSQSDAWHNFADGTHAEAEWSGFMKYNPVGTCDIHIFYTIPSGTATFRPSTTDDHYAQWPAVYTNCPFQDYGTFHRVKCTYTGLSSQLSHKVKLFGTPTSYTTASPVNVAVYEKDSNGDYLYLPNPSGVAGWTFN